jgi:hypothetical protein
MKKYILPSEDMMLRELFDFEQELIKKRLTLTSKGVVGFIYNTIEELNNEISLCKKCNCMTKTVNNKCGKCKETK